MELEQGFKPRKHDENYDPHYLCLTDDGWEVCTWDGERWEYGQGKYYGDVLDADEVREFYRLPKVKADAPA